MSNYADMPLDTTIQKGDIVTITGPGEHDVLVREVTRLDAWHDSAVVAGMVGPTADLIVILGREGRTLTRIQRPVPALPTVEGDYIITLSSGYRSVVSLRDGVWLNELSELNELDDVQWLITRGATLTRVIPADEVKRPEVDMDAATTALQKEWMTSRRDSYELDFKSVLRRVLEGEFDL